MKAMDKIVEDRENTAGCHNSEILCLHVNKLRGNSQFLLVPDKDRNRATISGTKIDK